MKEECEYSNEIPLKNDINVIILPLDGIDQFGYIKHTSISLDKIILTNKIEKIYTGKVNKYLYRLCKLNGIKLYSFYDDVNYLINENNLKKDAIKCFLEEKLSTKFEELKILVINENTTIKNSDSFNDVDAVINFSKINLEFLKDKIIIEMNDIDNVDLTILLNCKNVYLINQLLAQYLTKSGGKILYDSMVNR